MGASITVRLKNPETDSFETRRFWVCNATGRGSGYVYDTTDKPGTLGRQVSYTLASMGDMMTCTDDVDALRRAIRGAQRKRLAAYRKQRY